MNKRQLKKLRHKKVIKILCDNLGITEPIKAKIRKSHGEIRIRIRTRYVIYDLKFSPKRSRL